MTLSSNKAKVIEIGEKRVLPKPLSDLALRQFVRKAIAKDWIKEGWHSEVERAHRNISHDDILCGLGRSDWVVTKIRDCPKFKESPHTYEILTKDADEVELELVIAPNLKTGTLTVVSKY
jgi:hypothetical protein